jgi:hypothetical protein
MFQLSLKLSRTFIIDAISDCTFFISEKMAMAHWTVRRELNNL